MPYTEIKKKFEQRYRENISASEITTYKTGGNIDLLVYPNNTEELLWLFKNIKAIKAKYFIIGAGSNILISDKGFKGILINLKNINFINKENDTIEAGAGVLWDNFIEFSVENSLSGLEKTSHIPGTVGGAVRMNAGAFNQETFDCLEKFMVLNTENLKIEELHKENISYSYRYVSGIEKFLIISAKFKFSKGKKEELKKIREEIIRQRKEKQPLDYPSAGSVFKRPKGDYASRLIDICGLKGTRIGGAMVSEKHAGFIINYDNATSTDIYKLILKVKDEVYKKTGISLELEQILVGEF